jgi:spore maturation protein A
MVVFVGFFQSFPIFQLHKLYHGGMDMIMGWLLCIFAGVSCLCAVFTGQGSELAAAIPQGAQAGINLAFTMAGSLCLWTGIGRLLERAGITALLAKILAPLMHRIFPGTKNDPSLAAVLSGNVCANILGLGNAATPMGIQAVQKMAASALPGVATDEMCRLVVLNTASIQLIPATVAAVRAALGSSAPFDILPAVWITSICSAGLGVTTAFLLGKVWKYD